MRTGPAQGELRFPRPSERLSSAGMSDRVRAPTRKRGSCLSSRRASARGGSPATACRRSEEHTSELQSLMRISYAVFCLKKKTDKNTSEKAKFKHKTQLGH